MEVLRFLCSLLFNLPCVLSFSQHEDRAVSEAHDALGDGADKQARDAGAAVRGDDDKLGVFFLGIVGDAVSRLAEQDGRTNALELWAGQLLLKQLLDLLNPGLRIDDAPD